MIITKQDCIREKKTMSNNEELKVSLKLENDSDEEQPPQPKSIHVDNGPQIRGTVMKRAGD